MWDNGFDILGSMVGKPEVEAAFVKKEVDVIMNKLNDLASMTSRHDAFTLFRETWLPLITHHLRCIEVQPGYEYGLAELQEKQEDFTDKLRGNEAQHRHVTTPWLERLPVREGGVGLPCAKDIAPHAYNASREESEHYYWSQHTDPRHQAPAGLGAPFAARPTTTTSTSTPATPPKPQRTRVQEHVISNFRALLDSHHAPTHAIVNGIQETQDTYKKERLAYYDRCNKVGRQWLERGAPGHNPGSIHMSNTEFGLALARQTHVARVCEETLCENCGLVLTTDDADHRTNCFHSTGVPTHNSVQHAVIKVIDAYMPGVKITGETVVGTVERRTGQRTAKRADMRIPPNDFNGVGHQVVDFKFSAITSRALGAHALIRKSAFSDTPESLEAWSARQVKSSLQQAYKVKADEYKTFAPSPSIRQVPVTYLIFSTRGSPHEMANAWLGAFPSDMRNAIRRAIAFTLQLRLNKGVQTGLSREW